MWIYKNSNYCSIYFTFYYCTTSVPQWSEFDKIFFGWITVSNKIQLFAVPTKNRRNPLIWGCWFRIWFFFICRCVFLNSWKAGPQSLRLVCQNLPEQVANDLPFLFMNKRPQISGFYLFVGIKRVLNSVIFKKHIYIYDFKEGYKLKFHDGSISLTTMTSESTSFCEITAEKKLSLSRNE